MLGIRHHRPDPRRARASSPTSSPSGRHAAARKPRAALHASEHEIYRSVFATVGDALFLVDTQDGRILSGQSSSLQTVRLYPKEFLSMRDTDLSVAHQRRCRGSVAPDLQAPYRSAHRRKDGSVFPADLFVAISSIKDCKITVAAIRDMTPQASGTQGSFRLSHFCAALEVEPAPPSSAMLEPHELFQQICQIVIELEQMQVVWIGFVSPESDGFQLVAHAGMAPDYPHYLTDFPISSELQPDQLESRPGELLRQRTPEVDNDFHNDFQDDSSPSAWRPDNPGLGHSLRGCFSAAARRLDGRLPVRLRGRA